MTRFLESGESESRTMSTDAIGGRPRTRCFTTIRYRNTIEGGDAIIRRVDRRRAWGKFVRAKHLSDIAYQQVLTFADMTLARTYSGSSAKLGIVYKARDVLLDPSLTS